MKNQIPTYDECRKCDHCGAALEAHIDTDSGKELPFEQTVTFGKYTVCKPCYDDFNRFRKLAVEKIQIATQNFDVKYFEKIMLINNTK